MFELRPYNHRNNQVVADPFAMMDDFERRFFHDDVFGRDALAVFRTDITDEGDHFLLEADLPGFDKKDIKLDLNGNTLTVKAERHTKDEEKKGKYLRCERTYGTYSRQFDVSEINTEQISAKYEDGVLKLVLPKKEKVLPSSRQLTIE